MKEINEILKELASGLGKTSRSLSSHSMQHFFPFLSLLRFILLMIPFLCLILCLHLVSLPPIASYLPSYPSSTPCIDSLYSLCVYNESKRWDECLGHCWGHFRRFLLSPPVYRTLPLAPAPRPSTAPDYVRVIRGLDMLYQD